MGCDLCFRNANVCQVVSQKLLASDEAGSFLEAGDSIDDAWCQVEGCDFSLKGNRVCDRACRSQSCQWDGGDCSQHEVCYEKGCPREVHGNGTCDDSCNMIECDWDKGDCLY